MIPLKKGDGLVLFNGSRMIVESPAFLMWGSQNDWRVAAWMEDGGLRLPIQLIAIMEVWRKRIQVYPIPIEQPPLF